MDESAALRKQFQSLLNSWAQAIVSNDADRIAEFVHDDWALVDRAGPISRERFLEVVRSGELTHSEMTQEVVDARSADSSVVVIVRGSNRGTWKGEPFSADEWVTDVFTADRDSWRCVISALTPRDS